MYSEVILKEVSENLLHFANKLNELSKQYSSEDYIKNYINTWGNDGKKYLKKLFKQDPLEARRFIIGAISRDIQYDVEKLYETW
jgi:hypothetical protein